MADFYESEVITDNQSEDYLEGYQCIYNCQSDWVRRWALNGSEISKSGKKRNPEWNFVMPFNAF